MGKAFVPINPGNTVSIVEVEGTNPIEAKVLTPANTPGFPEVGIPPTDGLLTSIWIVDSNNKLRSDYDIEFTDSLVGVPTEITITPPDTSSYRIFLYVSGGAVEFIS